MLQFAVASGATVIATSSSDDKLQRVSQLGAKYTINYVKTPNWDDEVLKIVRARYCYAGVTPWLNCIQTNGEGVHHIVEVGGPATMEKSLNCVRMAGSIHIVGFLAGLVNIFA